MFQTWGQCLYNMPSDGQSLTNAAGPQSLLPTTDQGYTFPASFFDHVGQQLLLVGAGRVSNVVTTPGTLTLDVQLGGTTVFTSGAMQMSTTAHTNLPIYYWVLFTIRNLGANANFMAQGFIQGQPMSLTAVADSATTVATLMMPNTAPVVGGNFNSKATQAFDHRATFSVTTATTAITLHQLGLYSLN